MKYKIRIKNPVLGVPVTLMHRADPPDIRLK